MKKIIFILLFLVFSNFCFAIGGYGTISIAATITLQWDANTEPDLAGYKIYYKVGKDPGPPYDGTGAKFKNDVINSPVDVGNVTEAILGLPVGGYYVFAVTAYDSETPSLESDFSNEVWTNFNPMAVRNVRIIQILIGNE